MRIQPYLKYKMSDFIYITLDSGVRPVCSLHVDEINEYNEMSDAGYGWNHINTDEVVNRAANGWRNLVFRVPVNTVILTSNVRGSLYPILADYEVSGIPDSRRLDGVESYGVVYSTVEVAVGVGVDAIELKLKTDIDSDDIDA